MPGFHHSVAVSLLPLAVPVYTVAVAYLFAVYGCDLAVTERNFLTYFLQNNGILLYNGNGMVETAQPGIRF